MYQKIIRYNNILLSLNALVKMYLTDSPCLNCAKLILNAGIGEVRYINEYRDTAGLDLLRSFNVWCFKVDKES